MQNLPGSIRRCLFLGLAYGLLATSGVSAIVAYRATGSFESSDFPADIAIGDRFFVDFAFDDTVLDERPENFSGFFRGALLTLDFGLTPGSSSGTYPGGATSDGSVLTPDRIFDRFSVLGEWGAFPALGDYSFRSLELVLNDPSDTSSISDPGGNPPLAEVLHGVLDWSQFSNGTVRIDAKIGSAKGVVTSLMVVPEPSVIPLLFMGLAAMSRSRHRSRRTGWRGGCLRMRLRMTVPIKAFGLLLGAWGSLFYTSIARPALVGWYNFDEGGGRVAIDAAGGNGLVPNNEPSDDDDGVLVGNPTYVPGIAPAGSPGFGPFALHFDLGDRVDLGPAQDILQNVRGATIAAWIYRGIVPEGSELSEDIVAISTSFGGGNFPRFALRVAGFGAEFLLVAGAQDSATGDFLHVSSPRSYSTTTVHHVAATIDYLTDSFELFVDGQSVARTSGVKGLPTPDTPSAAAFIGAQSSGNSRLFRGTLDDVRIYNTVLSREEIAALAVPEPHSVVLLTAAATGLFAWRRRPFR